MFEICICILLFHGMCVCGSVCVCLKYAFTCTCGYWFIFSLIDLIG